MSIAATWSGSSGPASTRAARPASQSSTSASSGRPETGVVSCFRALALTSAPSDDDLLAIVFGFAIAVALSLTVFVAVRRLLR